jgi:hypothetical protein
MLRRMLARPHDSAQPWLWWLLGLLGLCAWPLGLGMAPEPAGWSALRPQLLTWLASAGAWDLLGRLLGGRALLALLPPGAPPERGHGAWLETYAASYWLGSLLTGAPVWMGPLLALAVWIWPKVMGPQAPRPRHPLAEPNPAALSRLLCAAALLWPLWSVLRSEQLPWEHWPWAVAVFGSLHFGIRLARQPAAVRAGALALASALLSMGNGPLPPAVWLASLLPWLRRADARSLWLSAGLLALGEFPWWQQALAAAGALIATAAPVRRRALLPLGLGVLLGAARLLAPGPGLARLGEQTTGRLEPGLWASLLLVALTALLWARARAAGLRAQSAPARPEWRLAALLLLLSIGALFVPATPELSSHPALTALLLLAWSGPTPRSGAITSSGTP